MFFSRNAFMAGVAKAVDLFWSSVNLSLKAIGIAGATNNTFRDDGPYNILPVRNGDATQGTLSPFGALTGSADPTAVGGSVWFDGSGDYLVIPNNDALNIGSGNFTYEFWWNPASLSVFNVLASKNWTSGFMCLVNNTTMSIFIGGSTAVATADVSSLIKVGSWSHVAIVRSGSTVNIFINGAIAGTGTNSSTISDTAIFCIGGELSGGYSSFGYVSNARFVKGTAVYTAAFAPPTAPLTAISGTSLLTCQSDTTITDASTNNFAITKYGDVRANPATPFGYGSVYFDGSGDILTVADNAALRMGTGDFTVELWWFPTTLSGYQTLYDKGYNSTGGMVLQTDSSALTVVMNGVSVITAGTFGPNVWNHVAVTRSGTTVRLFINGVLAGSGTSSADFSSTHNVGIGSSTNQTGNGVYPATGYISNVRTVKGTAVYTAAFTPPTAPLTAISGTSLLTCQDKGRIVDTSSNGFAITRAGDVRPVSDTPFAQKGDGRWSGYCGVSTADYVNVTPSSSMALGTGDFTIEFWARFETSVSRNTVLFWPSNTPNGQAGSIQSYGGTLYLYYGNGSTVTVAFTPQVGVWYHFASVRSSGTITWYINGEVKASIADSTNMQALTTLSIGAATSGADPHHISNVRMVKGTAVYTGAFTPPTAPLTAIPGTVLLTMQDNRFKDNSNSNATITKNGNPTISRFNPFGSSGVVATTNSTSAGSIYFGSGSNYMYYSANTAFDLPGDFTIEFWINPTSGMSESSGIVGHRQSGSFTNNVDWVIRAQVSAGKVGFGNNISGSYIDMGPLTYGNWSHYAISRSGSTIKTFCNGALITTVTDTGSYSSSSSNLVIGENAGNGLYYKGYISNLRIVKGTAVYTADFTPPTSPLTAISGTSLLVGQSAVSISDASSNAFTATYSGTVSANESTPLRRVTYPYGGSGYFDGNDWLSIPTPSSFAFGTGDFTIEFWVNPQTTSTAVNQIWFVSPGGSERNSVAIGMRSGYMWWLFGNGSTWVFERNAGTALPINTWNHVTVTRSGGTARLFVNGILIDSLADSTNINQGATWTVGGYGGVGYYLTGHMANVRVVKGVAVYTANFTPPVEPVKAIGGTVLLLNFDNAGIYDAAGSDDFAIVGTGTTTSTAITKYATGSTAFSGSTTYVKSTNTYNFNGAPKFTAECWFRPTRVSGANSYEGILTTRTGGVYSPFNICQDNAQLRWLVDTGTGWNATGGTLTANTWHHLAVCADGTTFRIFLNGTSVYSYTQSTWSGYGTIPFIVGGNLSENQYFNGNIEDVRLTMGVARYTSNFTVPSASFPTSSS